MDANRKGGREGVSVCTMPWRYTPVVQSISSSVIVIDEPTPMTGEAHGLERKARLDAH